MHEDSTQFIALSAAVRRFLLAPLGRPVAEAWVALAKALDQIEGRTPADSYVTARAITIDDDRWITYAIAAMSRLREAIDAREQPTTAKILLWQHGPCAIEAWSNLGDPGDGWPRREVRYGEGADPDRAIAAWERDEWRNAREVCGNGNCQARARKLAWAHKRLLDLTAGHGQKCPDGHPETCARCRVALELQSAVGRIWDDVDLYGRAAKAEVILRRLLDLHLPLVPAQRRRWAEDEDGWEMVRSGTLREADRLLPREAPDLCDRCDGLGVVVGEDGDESCCPDCEGDGIEKDAAQ